MTIDPQTYRVSGGSRRAAAPLAIGVAGLALSAVACAVDPHRFFPSYLTAFTYWVTIGLGGLFFTMLHHLVNAKWSVVLRRAAENIMSGLPLLAVFAVPLLFGMHDLYHWTHAEAVAEDPLLQAKAAYLNVPFFIVRMVFYFAVWGLLAYRLNRISDLQDRGGPEDVRRRLRVVSAPGMLLFALTSTFAAFDWLMSLDPHWYSTIFGVYIYSGGFLGALGLLVVLMSYQRRRGLLREVVTVEHYHDLGKLMFAFVIFWAYMAFSQYFLIWYTNVPEETVWFLVRWQEPWKAVSLAIVFGHFGLPFVALVLRATKRNVAALTTVSLWLLAIHWVDLHWIVQPNIPGAGAVFSWIDAATMAGIGGIFIWYVWRRHLRRPLVPVGDPGLQRSMQLTN